MRPVVILEFNELCPGLMKRFIAEGTLPNFARLHDESETYITRASEEPPALEPWIQWVSVHSGLDYAEHGVFSLNEGHKLTRPRVWDLLAAAGHRVLVCGSMNIRYESDNGFYLPDPWTTSVPPRPASLLPYFRFVQKHVLEYTKDEFPLSLADYARFFSFMARHGLSPSTVSSILGQFWSERGGKNRWKRAVVLDKLQFDLFSWHYRKLQPQFSTFFLNSTAHFQHLYWRNLEPEHFAIKPSPAEQEEYGSAVRFGYQEMDRLVGRTFDLVGKDAVVVLCTALSQQPCLTYEEAGGKVLYRPRDFESLLTFADVPPRHRVSPVMAEEFHVYFETPEDLDLGERRLTELGVGTGTGSSATSRPALRVRRKDGGLLLGCGIFDVTPPGATLFSSGGARSLPFLDVFYLLEGVKSGMHHPDGMLWVRTPGRPAAHHEAPVQLKAIAPTVLSWFSLPSPAFMKGKPLVGAPVGGPA